MVVVKKKLRRLSTVGSAILNQTRRGHLAVASSFLVLSYRLGLRLLSHTRGHLYMVQDEQARFTSTLREANSRTSSFF